jgi:HK97 gp10 family phage protein
LELISMTDDLDAYLNALPTKIRAPLATVIREQADMLSQAQQSALKALEQPPEETGGLEASCVVVDGPSDLEVFVQAGGTTTTKEVREGSGVGYDYAIGFEFGTSHQPARPFFYSTYHEHRDEMRDAITEALTEVLKQ